MNKKIIALIAQARAEYILRGIAQVEANRKRPGKTDRGRMADALGWLFDYTIYHLIETDIKLFNLKQYKNERD